MIQLSNSRRFVTRDLNKLSRNAHHIYSLESGPCFSLRTELDQIPNWCGEVWETKTPI